MNLTYQLKGWLTVSGQTKDECDERANDEIMSINDNTAALVEIVAGEEVDWERMEKNDQAHAPAKEKS